MRYKSLYNNDLRVLGKVVTYRVKEAVFWGVF